MRDMIVWLCASIPRVLENKVLLNKRTMEMQEMEILLKKNCSW